MGGDCSSAELVPTMLITHPDLSPLVPLRVKMQRAQCQVSPWCRIKKESSGFWNISAGHDDGGDGLKPMR